MAAVTLDRREVEYEQLPPVCLCCGAPSAEYRSKNFSWHPPWIIVLIVLGLLPFAIVALVLTKRMTVSAPLCARHKGHWTVRGFTILGGFLALLVLGVVATLVLSQNEDHGNDPIAGFLCLGTLGLGVVWLILALILQNTGIRPNEITDTTITLVNVSPEFIRALEEQRDEDERRYREEQRDYRREVGGTWRDRAPRPEPGDRYTERPDEERRRRRPYDDDSYRDR
jgi:hypothetical protein